MKKILAIAILITLFAVSTAHALSTDNWYQYNGYSETHSFSVKYPTTWKSKTYGDEMQGFAPGINFTDSFFLIQEYEGQTYDQVLQYYVNDETSLVEVEDVMLAQDDILAKRAIYLDIENDKMYPRTLVKRGSLMIVMSGASLDEEPNFPIPEKYRSSALAIHDSFTFTDEWHQYVDLQEKFSFIFPSALTVQTLADGVTVMDDDKVIFSIFVFEETAIEDAPKEAEGYSESLDTVEETYFNGKEYALKATYNDSEARKDLSRIIVENNGNSYVISDENIETNFPQMDYYNQYIVEMLESVEFFDMETPSVNYKTFPDVLEGHPNENAINSLAEKEIIAGYPDGTFQPDGEINRAELTKMIVEAISTEELVGKDCFPDVKDEWFAPYVCEAKEKGIVDGYEDGRFRPDQKINRVEAIKIITEAIFDIKEEELSGTPPSDTSMEDWYSKYFIYADNRNLLDKQHVIEERYFPDQNISRKEVAEMIYRSILNLPLTFL